MVHDDDLSFELYSFLARIILRVGGDKSTFDFLDRDVLDVESNVVSGRGLNEGFVMHLDGLDLSGESNGSESDDHTGLDDSGLDTSHGHCANT